MLKSAKKIKWEEQREDALLLREPIGTVLSIMTFNGPIVLMGMKIIPALLAGCTVIGKHAPESQFTSRLISEAIEEAELPSGILTLLAADTKVTQHLVSHPSIDMVSLTGGTSIGIEVVKQTADRLARTTLELGGKSPAIILEDADLDSTLDTLVPGSTAFMGQVCVNLSRVLVPKKRQDEIVDALASRYNSFEIGDPLFEGSQQGPIAVKRGLERTEQYVSSAKQQGANVITGGKRPSNFKKGWWYEPTLLSNTDNSMRVVKEEIFGPVTSVTTYDDYNDAIRLANDSDFGLAASIYGKDDDLIMNMAKQLQSGSVAINTAGISFMQPFGGYKKSGWGKECGDEGILEFTQIKQVIRG
jgi:acyl-CoA reductase-like NAD-dependent aldehyde dehydrogenase